MARPYSVDLRERVVEAVEQEGLSRRAAAKRFGVGIKTAIVWVQRFRATGSVAASRMGGHRPKKIVGGHREWLVKRCQGGDFTLRPGRRAGRPRPHGRLSGCLGVCSRRAADA